MKDYIVPFNKLNMSCIRAEGRIGELNSEDVRALKERIRKRVVFEKFLPVTGVVLLALALLGALWKGLGIFASEYGIVLLVFMAGLLISFAMNRRYLVASSALSADLKNGRKETYTGEVSSVLEDPNSEDMSYYAEVAGFSAVISLPERDSVRIGDVFVIERLPLSGTVLCVKRAT